MNNLILILVIFLLSSGFSSCKDAHSQEDFPTIDANELVPAPPPGFPTTIPEEPSKESVPHKSAEVSVAVMTLLATLCMEDGQVNQQGLDETIKCAEKKEKAGEIRECVKVRE